MNKGTTVAITNKRGTRKGATHIVRGASTMGNAAVDTVCGQTFLTVESTHLDALSKIATATDAPVECARCSR